MVFHVTRNVSLKIFYHTISMATDEYFTKDQKLFSAYSTVKKIKPKDIKECWKCGHKNVKCFSFYAFWLTKVTMNFILI